jgi:hypothetical protein
VTIRAPDFDRIIAKLGLETRDSGDLLAWFVYDGKLILRTRRSKKRGQDLPFQHSIRQQLKLTETELRSIIGCSVGRPEYIEILRRKGLL